MNTGQMLITIAAIFLLSLVILTINRGFLTTNTTMTSSRYGIMGVSLGTSLIEKATGKAFDHNTDTLAITSLNSLTNVNALGLDASESANYPDLFNDIDDYKCFRINPKLDTLILEGTNRTIIFKTFCDVFYVNPTTNPNNPSNSRTWHKRINVKVTSNDNPDTIKLSTIYSYWFFR